MLVYKTTNIITGKIYVGQTIKDDPDYLGSGVKIKNSINKHGIKNFTRETICECETQTELDDMEIFWILELNSTDPDIGYNIHSGGGHFVECNGTTREKISNTLTGRKLSKETCTKMSTSRTGDGHWMKKNNFDGYSDDTLEKMRDAKIGTKRSDESIAKFSSTMKEVWSKGNFKRNSYEGEKNPFYGKTHTHETKSIISKTQKEMRWVVNEENKCKRIHMDKLDEYLLNGFQRGRKLLKKDL